jgi:hypothetical protein
MGYGMVCHWYDVIDNALAHNATVNAACIGKGAAVLATGGSSSLFDNVSSVHHLSFIVSHIP